MAVLVVAEHDNKSLKDATLNTVTAAAALGDTVERCRHPRQHALHVVPTQAGLADHVFEETVYIQNDGILGLRKGHFAPTSSAGAVLQSTVHALGIKLNRLSHRVSKSSGVHPIWHESVTSAVRSVALETTCPTPTTSPSAPGSRISNGSARWSARPTVGFGSAPAAFGLARFSRPFDGQQLDLD